MELIAVMAIIVTTFNIAIALMAGNWHSFLGWTLTLLYMITYQGC